MPNDKSVELKIDNSQALASLHALNDLLNQIETKMRGIANLLGNGSASDTQRLEFADLVQQQSATRGAIAAAQNSIAVGRGVTSDIVTRGALSGLKASGASTTA